MNIFRNRQTALLKEEIENKDKQILALETALKNKEQRIENLLAEMYAHSTLVEFFNPDKKMGETERKKYVSDVALSYINVFKKKFPEFIFDQQQALSIYGRPEKEYDIFRCNINVIRLFEEWMIKLTNEHLGDLEESRENVVDAQNLVAELRENYNI